MAVELARVMAVAGKRTLLVECDRGGARWRTGWVRAPVGLCAVVMGDEEPGRAIVATRQPRMHFLDAEAGVTSPVDILDSQRFRRLLGCLAARYDHVVIDTRRWARCGRRRRRPGIRCDAACGARSLSSAQASRRQPNSCAAGANLVGTVMNCCDTATSAYYAAYGDKAE
ncbi:MAG: hypothetical protein ACLSVD_12840 [Eggerthellaceae bacterium]